MSRSGYGRARRRAGSRPTARAGRRRLATTTPELLPDGDSRLSEGVVVETRLTARLLGIRLLRVDGVVLMSPARVVGPARPATSLDRAALPARAGGSGQVLAQAAQLLRENDARLHRLR